MKEKKKFVTIAASLLNLGRWLTFFMKGSFNLKIIIPLVTAIDVKILDVPKVHFHTVSSNYPEKICCFKSGHLLLIGRLK